MKLMEKTVFILLYWLNFKKIATIGVEEPTNLLKELD